MPVNRPRRVPPKAPRTRPAVARPRRATQVERRELVSVVEQLDALRHEVERRAAQSAPPRWNADPRDAQRSVARLVLTLVEFVRQLLERQALRRMDRGTLTPSEIEAIGTALMRLEETIRDLARRFDLQPEELNLDLGPLGKLI
jgi:hypothetical protein